jgi:ABC-2 type transport system ATP-binding protein
MRMITGYIPPTYGKVEVAGIDVVENPMEAKRRIGYLPEIPPVYPELTVESYLDFVAAAKDIKGKERKKKIDEAVAKAGLEKVRKRLIRNISKGYRQRLGIAQAIVADPEVFILDEPTIGLDPKEIVEIRELIKSLAGERTVILSTHILQEVTQVCDTIAIINEGKLLEFGKIEELEEKYSALSGAFVRVRKKQEFSEAVKELGFVKSVRERAGGFELEFDKPGGMEEIAKLIVEKNLGLEEIRPLRLSIEEVYLRVIAGGVK